MTVVNDYSKSVWIKPEEPINGQDLLEVKPGAKFDGLQDGVAIPWLLRGYVYKTVNVGPVGVDLTIDKHGKVSVDYVGEVLQIAADTMQEYFGNGSGWKSIGDFTSSQRKRWKPLFEKAK